MPAFLALYVKLPEKGNVQVVCDGDDEFAGVNAISEYNWHVLDYRKGLPFPAFTHKQNGCSREAIGHIDAGHFQFSAEQVRGPSVVFDAAETGISERYAHNPSAQRQHAAIGYKHPQPL